MSNTHILILLSLFSSFFATTNAFMPWSTFRDTMFPSRDMFRLIEYAPFEMPLSGDTFAAMVRADWRETVAAHVISVDIPGVKRRDVTVEVDENRVVRIGGERREEEEEGEKWHMAERTNGKFWRRFRMPANADLENVTARVEDGVLRVTVAKVVEERRRHSRVIDIMQQEVKGTTAEL
ncbi:unnamed protein product [Sphenostylis stenocarpa]|uniref:SHSP domain-containing protein n=1 Tax=Sphenostylis stenocarpa TaxID=92480 RepID=A0AA86SEV8_9FABA|nr:unnamed protein product [Sphenostylis stenocarpa]